MEERRALEGPTAANHHNSPAVVEPVVHRGAHRPTVGKTRKSRKGEHSPMAKQTSRNMGRQDHKIHTVADHHPELGCFDLAAYSAVPDYFPRDIRNNRGRTSVRRIRGLSRPRGPPVLVLARFAYTYTSFSFCS